MTTSTTWQSVMMEFPTELRTPMWHFAELLEDRFVIPHQDFTELKQTVERLTRAQDKTEQRLEQLTQTVESLAAAQERTEQRVEQLAQAQESLTVAQERTEQRLEQLAQAQERTEHSMQALTKAVSDLGKTLEKRLAELGSRWGLQTESTLRATIRRIFRDVGGVTVKQGEYGGRQVDIVIQNGEHILLEVTSRMHAKDIRKMYASADDYREREGVEPTLMVAASYVSPALMRKIVNLERPIEIFSYGEEDEEEVEEL